jgi:CubicO group peptidase (beta-lactamase class C family)
MRPIVHPFAIRALWPLALLAATVAFPGSARAGDPRVGTVARGDWDGAREAVADVTRALMKQSDVVGLSLAVVDGDRVAWADAFGRSDKAAKVDATPETVYRAGGVSGLLTIIAALQLSDAGRLDLDAPVSKILPAFRLRPRFPDARPITVRDLMTHHSGLPMAVAKGARTTAPAPFSGIVDALRDESPTNPPGRAFDPSEAGMTVLGTVVQAIAGRDFAPYLRETLLAPLRMATANFDATRERSILGARGHRKGKPEEEPAVRDLPASGLNASVLDLARVVSMTLAEGRSGDRVILRPATAADMIRTQNAGVPLDYDMRVGLGWMGWALLGLEFPGAGPVWHLSGESLDFHTMVVVLPAQGLGVVVMANSAESAQAVNRAAEEALVAALQAKSGWKRPAEPTPLPDGPDLTEAEMAAWAGDWATLFGLVRIYRKGDSLRCDAFGRTFHLVPRTDGRLAVRLRLGGFIPVSLGPFDRVGLSRETVGDREVLVAEADGTRMPTGEHLRPAPVSEAWARRAGDYVIANAGSDAILVARPALKVTDGRLLVEFEMPRMAGDLRIRLPLVPVSDDEAVLGGIGPGLGETFRIVPLADGTEGIRYSGFVMKRKP